MMAMPERAGPRLKPISGEEETGATEAMRAARRDCGEAVLNMNSVCFSRTKGGLTPKSERPNNRGGLEQVLANWEESEEEGGLDGP